MCLHVSLPGAAVLPAQSGRESRGVFAYNACFLNVYQDPLQFASSYKDASRWHLVDCVWIIALGADSQANGKTLMKGLLTRQPRAWAEQSLNAGTVPAIVLDTEQRYSNIQGTDSRFPFLATDAKGSA